MVGVRVRVGMGVGWGDSGGVVGMMGVGWGDSGGVVGMMGVEESCSEQPAQSPLSVSLASPSSLAWSP